VLNQIRDIHVIPRNLHPGITAEYDDVAEPGPRQQHFEGADVVVMLQAQIGGTRFADIQRNNIDSTRLVLDAVRSNAVGQLVHISSSVVESVADDFYTNTKKQQEQLVLSSDIPCAVLRPTLMF